MANFLVTDRGQISAILPVNHAICCLVRLSIVSLGTIHPTLMVDSLLSPSGAITNRIVDMLNSSKSYFHCFTDSWGLRIFDSALKSPNIDIRDDVEVRIIASRSFDLKTWPDLGPMGPFLRIAEDNLDYSCFLVDGSSVLLVNGTSGKGLFQNSFDLCQSLDFTSFQPLWDNGIPAEHVLALKAFDGGEEILSLGQSTEIYKIFTKSVAKATEDDIKTQAKIGLNFIGLLEDEKQLAISKQSIESTIPLFATLLHQDLGESSGAKYDPITKKIEFDPSKGKRTYESIWYYALTGILERSGPAIEALQNIPDAEQNSKISESKIVMGQRKSKRSQNGV